MMELVALILIVVLTYVLFVVVCFVLPLGVIGRHCCVTLSGHIYYFVKQFSGSSVFFFVVVVFCFF